MYNTLVYISLAAMRDNRDQSPQGSQNATRRKVLAASSGLGGTVIGLSGVTGQVAAEDEELTTAELERSLRESRHVGLRPKYTERREALLEGINSVGELDESVTVSRDHPDVYFGELQNAQAPSGTYCKVAEPGAWRERDGPLASDHDYRGEQSVSVGGELGCTSVVGTDVCAFAEAGIELSASTDLKIGGELFLDIGLTVAGQELTVSLAGFGFFVGPSDRDGYCFSPNINLPSYLPEGSLDVCGDISLETRNGGSEARIGVGVSALDVCADPCPVVSCEACGTVVSGAITLYTPWFSFPDL